MKTKEKIIPKPKIVKQKDGQFVINNQTKISTDIKDQKLALLLKDLIFNLIGLNLNIINESEDSNIISLKINDVLKNLGNEGYLFKISENKIEISSNKRVGIFYGIQSLRLLLPIEVTNSSPNNKTSWELPCMIIEDTPRFSYRGFMLDVARHFHPISTIKRILDLMGTLKLNRFHWHLTDDQGWRIEIKKYPKLTEIGSKRKNSKIGGWTSNKFRNEPHGGFYTQEEIREVISYANDRYITVIPEIEMPGHASAAIAAYPELSCTGKSIEVPITFGIKKDVLCIGKESTLEFLKNVLEEVIDLFPSEIIHIGGDEAPRTRWKECSDCQLKIKSRNMKNESELQTYLTNEIALFLKSKGRKLMGWNEILDDNLDNSAIAQWWFRGKDKVFDHLKGGRKIVSSRVGFVYLDYNYVFTPLKKIYNFEPIFSDLDLKFHKNIIGVEAPLWTEWIPNTERMDWQIFPRLIALAEVAWTSKENKDYSSFRIRLPYFLKYLDKLKVDYAPLKVVDPGKIQRLLKAKTVLKWPEI